MPVGWGDPKVQVLKQPSTATAYSLEEAILLPVLPDLVPSRKNRPEVYDVPSRLTIWVI
jgi:hypothetical protein